jgi:hypothetical protein
MMANRNAQGLDIQNNTIKKCEIEDGSTMEE